MKNWKYSWKFVWMRLFDSNYVSKMPVLASIVGILSKISSRPPSSCTKRWTKNGTRSTHCPSASQSWRIFWWKSTAICSRRRSASSRCKTTRTRRRSATRKCALNCARAWRKSPHGVIILINHLQLFCSITIVSTPVTVTLFTSMVVSNSFFCYVIVSLYFFRFF